MRHLINTDAIKIGRNNTETAIIEILTSCFLRADTRKRTALYAAMTACHTRKTQISSTTTGAVPPMWLADVRTPLLNHLFPGSPSPLATEGTGDRGKTERPRNLRGNTPPASQYVQRAPIRYAMN